MPPKGKGKVTEDKTFGMKNKNKSAKVQKYVAQVNDQAKMAGKNKEALAKEKEKAEKARAKEAEDKRKKEELALYGKPIQKQTVAFGVDPKTVLCSFFKAGLCEKGNKCKFSHDKNVERKAEKVNLYEDTRAKPVDKKLDTMDTWDEAKLASVVNSKKASNRTTTEIVCKYFIQAIEDQKYGWFWECPNGTDCMYRHALPPGFVLKSEKKAREEAAKKETISLEDFLEVERHKLKPPLTPVTVESFAAWKKTRQDKKQAEAEAAEKAKASQRAAGKMTGMSGKEMFEFGGELYGEQDEDEQEDDWDISRLLARYREEDESRAENELHGLNNGAGDVLTEVPEGKTIEIETDAVEQTADAVGELRVGEAGSNGGD